MNMAEEGRRVYNKAKETGKQGIGDRGKGH
jgi:hypothetical protein